MSHSATSLVLRKFLDQPDALIFVGSGISCWSGLPSWEQLVQELINCSASKGGSVLIAREALANKQLLEAIDALQITPSEISETMRLKLGFAKATPHEIHSLLVRLGPQRFVTTNYDSLIEQQLGYDRRLQSFRTITNRQVAELADIMKASADAFVYKPHGDLSDADSLVLASRDYERIIAGETNQVRWALETLLVTRPVLFLGYGLRDPDTTLVLRVLRDRYRGNIGHFMAVIADATPEHQNYWWDRYRIRILSYATTQQSGGRKDHSALLSLLRSTIESSQSKTLKSSPPHSHHKIGSRRASSDPTALLRYAVRLVQPEAALDFPLKTMMDRRRWTHFSEAVHRFDGAEIEGLLTNFPTSFVLAGPAGSGKSFAITKQLSDAGRAILNWSAEPTKTGPPVIPVLLDARIYDGSFEGLLAVSVPKGLDLIELSNDHEILVILDSLDEMPVHELDKASWRTDLEKFVRRLRKVRVLFGTRRAALVNRPDLPVFTVMQLNVDFIRAALAQIGVSLTDLSDDFQRALATPFMLSVALRFLARRGEIRSAPALLSAFLSEIASATSGVGATGELAALAASLIEEGRETIPIRDAIIRLTKTAQAPPPHKRNQIDRFVAAGLMKSEIDEHVRFVHRIVTEYLAANYLLQKRIDHSNILKKLSTYRWDNSIVWAFGQLDETTAAALLTTVFNIDPALAYRIVVAEETGSSRLWSQFIFLAQANPERIHSAAVHGYDRVKPPSDLILQLKQLMKEPDALGGWAASLCAPHMSEADLCDWVEQLRTGRYSITYLNASSGAMASRINPAVLNRFKEALHALPLDGFAEKETGLRGN